MQINILYSNSTLKQKFEASNLIKDVEFKCVTQSTDNQPTIDEIFNAIESNSTNIALINANQLPYPLPNSIKLIALINLEGNQASVQQPINSATAVITKNDNQTSQELFKAIDIRQYWGKVHITGCGAGNVNLLTLKAMDLISKADVIYYDDLVDNAFLANFSAEKIYVGKRKNNHSFDQSAINELLYQAALKGLNVVRLKGGDPLIFGRGAEEFHYMGKRFIESEITPGITAAFAAASQFVVPLTDRDLARSVSFISGHNTDKIAFPKSDTLVIYMGASNQQIIAQKLIKEGWRVTTPVAIIKDASYDYAQSVHTTLEALAIESSPLGSPAIIIVGQVARKGGINPKRWLYTGTQQTDYECDGVVIHSPLISIKPIEATPEINSAISNIASFNRIVFTSRYSVRYFFSHLFNNQLDVRALANIKITSIGKTTSSELKQFGLIVNPVTKEESLKSIISYFKEQKISNEQILLPRSNSNPSTLSIGLAELGNKVTQLAVYANSIPDGIVKHDLSHFEGVIFTSPSTVTNFIITYGSIPSHLKIITRGEETKQFLENEGLKFDTAEH